MRTSTSAPAPAPASGRFDISLFSQPAPPPTGPARSADLAAPEPYAPPGCTVPVFPPIRAGGRGGRRLVPRALRVRRKPLALGLGVVAAALAVSAVHGSPPRAPVAVHSPARVLAADRGIHDVADEIVRAPVRITDAGAVRLLRPGDRVDVLAASRVVASAVPVVAVPEQPSGETAPTTPEGSDLPTATADAGTMGGALVVLAVPRRIAAALSGAAVSSPLAVALC
ncbi:hypothetical protein OG900_25415 [Streptomyces sp. NBC_00433]